MDFRHVLKSSKSGLTTPDGGASPVIYIKSLAAPLLVSQTGELCDRLRLAPDTLYTIGRSKKTCDIVFLDTRVSRKHCQLYVLPQNNALTLLDGAPPNTIPKILREANLNKKFRRFSGRESKRRLLRFESADRNEGGYEVERHLQRTRRQSFDCYISMESDRKTPHLANDIDRIGDGCTIDGRRLGTGVQDVIAEGTRVENLSVDLLFTSTGRFNRSLNGIFVNGSLIDSGKLTVLSSGDEVSLVGPTKAGQSLDVNCHLAVGFTVETEPSAKETDCAQSSAKLCSHASSPSYKRKRRTFSETMDDTSSNGVAVSVNLTVNAAKSNNNKSKIPDLGTHTDKKRAQGGNSFHEERPHCCDDSSVVQFPCSELVKWPDYMRANCPPKEQCSGASLQTGKLGAELVVTLDQGKNKHLNARDNGITSGKVSSFPIMVESFASTVTGNVGATKDIGSKTSSLSSDWLNLDKRLVSTISLIEASARLRRAVSGFLTSSSKGHYSTDQVELRLTNAKEEYPAGRDKSSLNANEQALDIHRETSSQLPLFPIGVISSPDVMLSDHSICCPSKGIEISCRFSALARPECALRDTIVGDCRINISSYLDANHLVKTKGNYLCTESTAPNEFDCFDADSIFVNNPTYANNFRLHPVERSPANGGALNSDVVPKETQVKTHIPFASSKAHMICEEKSPLLEGFAPLDGEQLGEWKSCLCRATNDSQLSGKETKTNLKSNLSKLSRTSMVPELMIRDVQTDIRKGVPALLTELHTGNVYQDDKDEQAQFSQAVLSDQRLQVEKTTPCNAQMSPIAMKIFEGRKERCHFDSLCMPAGGCLDKLRKTNSEIMQKPPVRSPAKLDDICQLLIKDQIGGIDEAVAKIRTGEGIYSGSNGDLDKEAAGSLCSSPMVDIKDLSTDPRFCVSAPIDTMKGMDIYSVDFDSASLKDVKPSPVQTIFCLQNAPTMNDDSVVKYQFVEPAGISKVDVDTEDKKGISCACPATRTVGLSFCKVECAGLSCCSVESLPCVFPFEKVNVIEDVAFLGASKLQLEPAHHESMEKIGVGVSSIQLNCEDDTLNMEVCKDKEEELQHIEVVSRKHVNLDVTSEKNPDTCHTNDSHFLLKTIPENALSKKELDVELLQPDFSWINGQMSNIATTNAACNVLHINQEQCINENLAWPESFQEEACVSLGIHPNLMVEDQGNKGRVDLQENRSLIDSPYSSGYCLNQLEDVANKGSSTYTSKSIQDLLAPVDDLEAVFIATFTYDLPWLLAFAGFSRDLPVTIACHNTDRCWSLSKEDRCEKPYLDWPNVTLVYPPFPNVCAFGNGKGSKRRGIGCHHPKLFLLRRTSSLRVIISSANLTPRQWFAVSNNVWWQDFPVRGNSNFLSLFQEEEHGESVTSADFALQLATFIAALLIDCPLESHWVTDLADIDFSSAVGSLVTSIPGLHHPFYHNAPKFLVSLEMESINCQHGDSWNSKHLGVVSTAVVGITYRYRASADPKGVRIRALAAILNEGSAFVGLTMPVLLKRAKYVAADPNAVSVIVTSKAKGCSQDLFLQDDLRNADIHTLESNAFQSEEDFVKLGFLPRDVASWLAVLCDGGFFSFAACIWPKEALAVASGQSDGVVKLALYVFQGPKFSELSTTSLSTEEVTAFCGLLQSLHHPWGLWRLEQVLSKYNWQESEETDFFFGSSSIGTSVDAKFLAAFAAAAGRRALPSACSDDDSDPEWGCWTAGLEADNPSIGIVFPSIERVQKDKFAQFGLLCFAESAWERLKSAHLLYDAIPCSPDREGFPMHVKVARRRFQKSASSRPYGWIYCGSHNFSPAAWGRPSWSPKDGELATSAGIVLGSTLSIANYEIGIVLVEPPPHSQKFSDCEHEVCELKNESTSRGLDRYPMPFKMPPPKYKESDRPATGKAMYEAFMEMKAMELIRGEENFATLQSEVPVE